MPNRSFLALPLLLSILALTATSARADRDAVQFGSNIVVPLKIDLYVENGLWPVASTISPPAMNAITVVRIGTVTPLAPRRNAVRAAGERVAAPGLSSRWFLLVPLVIGALRRALRGDYEAHKRLVRFTWPIWMYVSVTGVLVYLMLYHLAPALHS